MVWDLGSNNSLAFPRFVTMHRWRTHVATKKLTTAVFLISTLIHANSCRKIRATKFALQRVYSKSCPRNHPCSHFSPVHRSHAGEFVQSRALFTPETGQLPEHPPAREKSWKQGRLRETGSANNTSWKLIDILAALFAAMPFAAARFLAARKITG